MTPIWTVSRTANARFSYRIAIEHDGRTLFAVRAQSPWPGPGQQIFCLKETEFDPAEPLEVVERVPVAHMARVGRKTSVVLDRAVRKRCEFLVVTKPRRDGAGTHEQIFFRTEAGIRSHRSRSRLELLPASVSLTVLIDTGERYAWKFPQARAARRRLPVGDYALVEDDEVVALVERKTFDNFLTDLGSIQALHHQFADLARHPMAAVVVEAQYGDFLDDKRVAGRWPTAHVARAIAELAVMHPRLPVVFAGSRKLANQWAVRWFTACALRSSDVQLELVRERDLGFGVGAAEPSIDQQVRHAALHELAEPFAFVHLAARFPDVSRPRLRRVLKELAGEGRLLRIGRGRGTLWARQPIGA